jgi:hypothetical protein
VEEEEEEEEESMGFEALLTASSSHKLFIFPCLLLEPCRLLMSDSRSLKKSSAAPEGTTLESVYMMPHAPQSPCPQSNVFAV